MQPLDLSDPVSVLVVLALVYLVVNAKPWRILTPEILRRSSMEIEQRSTQAEADYIRLQRLQADLHRLGGELDKLSREEIEAQLAAFESQVALEQEAMKRGGAALSDETRGALYYGSLFLLALFAVAATAMYFGGRWVLSWFAQIDLSIITNAFAQVQEAVHSGRGAELLNYIMGAIVAVMLGTFLVAVVVLLFTPSKPANRQRLAAADNIVKTFIGFFIGLMTAFVKQALGG